MAETWYKCTECRTEIPFGGKHWVCSVSTCNRAKFRLVFCSVACWDSHLSGARHRDAWAVEAKAPTKEEWAAEQAEEARAPQEPRETQRIRPPVAVHAPAAHAAVPTPYPPSPSAAVRRVVGDASPMTAAAAEGVRLAEVADKDVLVVVSKLKKYIKDRSGMSCADAVIDVLSDHLRNLCDDAIRAAGRDERKTVLERDVARPRR